MLLFLLLMSLMMVACTEKDDDAFVAMEDLTIAPDFDWQSSRQVELEIEVLNSANVPIDNIVFEIFTSQPQPLSSPIAKGVTLEDGKYLSSLTLPTAITKIWARGYMGVYEIPISGNMATVSIGGAYVESSAPQKYSLPDSKDWTFLPGMTFSPHGKPSPMTNTPLEADFLSRVNTTLPESVPIDVSHPQYLDPDVQTNLKLVEPSNIWLTFVTEGAGYLNALGFHTYPSAAEPQTPAEVGSHTIVLPNASLNGSGGKLTSGDTVYLGAFEAGITMGWFLVADGFTQGPPGTNISTTALRYYSSPHLNPEPNPADQQHSILVFDDISQRLVIGFEDLPRNSGSDDDFNDLVFFLTVDPITAADLTGVPPMDTYVDTDDDGINDVFDDYPEDPDLAFNNYTYGPSGLGTLAFEDLWPDVGDYDFNDMVVDYNYNQITQAGNRVKKVEMSFTLKALGARWANGFGVQVPFLSSNIYDVTPSHPQLFEHETDSPTAVMKMYDSAFDLIPEVPGSFINTEIADSYIDPVDFSVNFMLTNPVAISGIEPSAPYNPFIFVNGVRSHEIHLPGYEPTARMNMDLFGTGDDASLPDNWYKTDDYLNWAVNIPQIWDYPIEKVQVSKGYLKFKHWAQSSGGSYQDWYQDLPGYRDEAYIYQLP